MSLRKYLQKDLHNIAIWVFARRLVYQIDTLF